MYLQSVRAFYMYIYWKKKTFLKEYLSFLTFQLFAKILHINENKPCGESLYKARELWDAMHGFIWYIFLIINTIGCISCKL